MEFKKKLVIVGVGSVHRWSIEVRPWVTSRNPSFCAQDNRAQSQHFRNSGENWKRKNKRCSH